MKIGVDASCWTNKRGYGRYTRELLNTLLNLDDQNEYRFFLDEETARLSEDLPESAQRVIVKTSQAASQAASASGHRSLRDLWAMRRAVHRQGQDLDLLYFPSVYTYFPPKGRTKTVVTIHDTTAERFPKLIFPSLRSRLAWNIKVRWAVRRASLITTVSEASKTNIMEEFGVPAQMVKVVPDAVGSEFSPVDDRSQATRLLRKFGMNGDEPFILYVGGISPHKNLATLVRAYASLIQGTGAQSAKLMVVGDFQGDVFYSSYPKLLETIQLLGLSEKVIFTGYVTDPDLVHLYNSARVLVMPSFDEGFGLPAVEAMACGTPVVGSRAGALPEVIGDAGLLFDPYQPEELKVCLQRLLENQDLRQELGLKGIRRAGGFTWERSARAALAAFKDLAGDHGPQAV